VRFYFEDSILGKVTDKYRLKWNQNSRELDISEAEGVSHIYLFDEKTGFWDYVMVGDSLIKDSNTLNIKVIRNGQVKIFTLNHGCGNFERN
jgi:hypothetical protein